MTEFSGHDSNWDEELLDIEANAFKQGQKDGERDAEESGYFEDGCDAGLMKGMALGIQIGYIASIAAHAKANHPQITPRLVKRCDSILEKAVMIPNSNDANIDFETAVKEIHSISKLVCSSEDYISHFKVPSNEVAASTASNKNKIISQGPTDW